ncbi:MAG TPA: carboxypeptidase-like regulatory domain-containing protein [Solirubrobacteraceae bacterium]|nr:carboxypeptidase-like regulatory domain-containing protein [Solirubrobacteraceae bacterium]
MHANGNTPVSGASVTLTAATGHIVGIRRARPDGTFALEPPAHGQYTATVTADGHRPVSANLQIGAERPAMLEFELETQR